MASFLFATLIALALLAWWVHQREQETKRRQEHCVHPPEQQKTIRVNNIMHPGAMHLVIPGRRWVKKHCIACGWQRSLYSPTLQPYDEFLKEYDQETIDREAQWHARTQAHFAELEAKEKIRQRDEEKKRKKRA